MRENIFWRVGDSCEPSEVLAEARLYAALCLALGLPEGMGRLSIFESHSDEDVLFGPDRLHILTHRHQMARGSLYTPEVMAALGGQIVYRGDVPEFAQSFMGRYGPETSILLRSLDRPVERYRILGARNDLQGEASRLSEGDAAGRVYVQPYTADAFETVHFIVGGRAVTHSPYTYYGTKALLRGGMVDDLVAKDFMSAPAHGDPLITRSQRNLINDLSSVYADMAHGIAMTGLQADGTPVLTALYQTDPGDVGIMLADPELYAKAISESLEVIVQQQMKARGLKSALEPSL